MIRIISGSAGGRKIKTPRGMEVRPTLDRVREAYFSIIGKQIEDSFFLDCCAGSGAVGIEALSRGAGRVTFIEQSKSVSRVIESNLVLLKFTSGHELLLMDIIKAIKVLSERSRKYDLIFFSPPYADFELYNSFMESFRKGKILHDETILAVQHENKTPVKDEYSMLKRYRSAAYGQTILSFYRLK